MSCLYSVLSAQSKANQYASRALKQLNIRIELVADAVNAPDVVRRFGRDLEFVPEVADMIVDSPVGIVVKVFVPDEVYLLRHR